MRAELLMRKVRMGAVWLVLLALALPGFASVRGICCAPEGVQDRPDCCAASDKGLDKVPGLATMAMASMAGSGLRVVAECAPVPVAEVPEYVVQSERLAEQGPLAAPGRISATFGEAERLSDEASRYFKMDRMPPGISSFDPLSIALRI